MFWFSLSALITLFMIIPNILYFFDIITETVVWNCRIGAGVSLLILMIFAVCGMAVSAYLGTDVVDTWILTYVPWMAL